MRRAAVLLLAIVLVAGYGAGSTLAVDNIGSRVKGAVAEWWTVEGDVTTGVLIQVADELDHGGRAPSLRTVGVNVQVTQQYEDPVSGEPVYRQLMSEPMYAPVADMRIHALVSAGSSTMWACLAPSRTIDAPAAAASTRSSRPSTQTLPPSTSTAWSMPATRMR